MSFELTHSDTLERMCTGKNRYADKKSAQTYINGWQRVRGRHGRPQWLRAYHCPHCNGWHVTKGKPKPAKPAPKIKNRKFKI